MSARSHKSVRMARPRDGSLALAGRSVALWLFCADVAVRAVRLFSFFWFFGFVFGSDQGMVSEVKGSPERSAKADSPPYMRSVGLIDSSGRSTRQMLVAATGSGQHNDRTRGEWRAPNFATQGRVELVASGSHLLVALLAAL